MAKKLLILMLLSMACGRGYSDGDRVGTISKFSRKGLLVKSWEGEMVLGGLRRNSEGQAVANVWQFTVHDERLVAAFQKATDAGQTVRVKYSEWLVHGCTVDTDYEALSVAPVTGN